ncbi:hypothetical protein LG275_11100 [Chryseomicrobium palamuruense]
MNKYKTKALKEDLRRKRLEAIKKNDQPIMTGVKLNYKGDDKVFNVYKIPLECLVYNPYNGRIGTKVKTFEVNSRKLNPEIEEDILIIEEFLWDSKPDRNKKTLQSLLKDKQREYGIVSKNGYIIDGNRRASLLNRINNQRDELGKKQDVSHAKYFNAIILDDDADEKEILKLETTYQMGRDEKLEYNATEKYLKTKRLIDVGYTEDEIAIMMNTDKTTINKNLQILELMDSYLSLYEYDQMYAMLEKREGQFVDLNNYFKAYENRSGNAKTNWNPSDQDINDMLIISFDYIRAQYEGKEFRTIAQNGKSSVPKSIFAHQDLWNEFKARHFKAVDSIEEKHVEDYLKKEDIDANIVDVLSNRDDEWTDVVLDSLKENLKRSKNKLELVQQSDRPYLLLEKALNALKEIDLNQKGLFSEEALELIKEINSEAYYLRKSIDKELKNNG